MICPTEKRVLGLAPVRTSIMNHDRGLAVGDLPHDALRKIRLGNEHHAGFLQYRHDQGIFSSGLIYASYVA